jgi:hypothetical protein
MELLKHCFKPSVKQWFIPDACLGGQTEGMLDAQTLAERICVAMDKAKPKRLTLGDLAREFDVTPQAVHGWR